MSINRKSSVNTRSLRRFIIKIRASFKDIILEMRADTNGCGTIISDNFHLIRRCYAEAVFGMKGVKNIPYSMNGVPVIYEYIYNFCRYDKSLLTKEAIESFFINMGNSAFFTFAEAAMCINVMKACCIEIIARNISSSDRMEKVTTVNRQLDILRLLRRERFSDITEKICRAEKLLTADAVYASMDKRSKSEYRFRIENKAIRDKKTEESVILDAQELASKHEVGGKSHFGYWLYENKKRYYVPLCLILPLLVAIVLGVVTYNFIIAVVSLLPLYFIVKSILDSLYSYRVKPSYIPRIIFERKAPKTLICSITVIDDIKGIDKILANIEKISVTNRQDGFMFGLLADFKGSNSENTEKDEFLLTYLKDKLSILESKYGKIFFSAVRKRTYNSASAVYEGKERKRGAICDFITAITEEDRKEFLLFYGDVSDAVYFAALDSDTLPAADSIKNLVGVLEHPFSSPVLNSDGMTVSGGYGIAVPRIELKASSWAKNLFTRLFGGIGGSEVYSNPSFSVYSDLYGDGIFAGKGVIRINLFYNLLCNHLPDNRILSHDIIEGGYLRTVYVSDTAFYDTMPINLFSYLKRAHRWIRGDIQNSYFLKKYHNFDSKKFNPLSFLTRFKITDNIIRALYHISLTVCIIASVRYPITAVIGITGIFMPLLLSLIVRLRNPANRRYIFYGFDVIPAIFRSFLACCCELILLPMFAYNAADAIIRSIVRLIRNDKAKLLQWVTAEDADKQQLQISNLLKTVCPQLIGIVLLFSQEVFLIGALWISGIALPYLLSINKKVIDKKINVEEIRKYLKAMWEYYTDFLTAENNYLPPDNFQEEPLNIEVQRTSPSNIGLVILSILGGRDVGLINNDELYQRLSQMITAIEKLPKFRGNLYNWYDIKTLTPLAPAFISFVDSGNFAVCLETLKRGLLAENDIRAERLAARVESLLKEMDLGFMYDENSGLFYIGYDTERQAFTDGVYDLYASEATLSSYYCIAKGIVPFEHWKNLGRSVCERFGRMYVKSWTGTMFEYYLPAIFLPIYKGTFNSQMLKSAMIAQQTKNLRLPWGRSESGYYLFDEKLYYQYKAFGVQKLAFKKGMDSEDVIAPYASFLALPFYPGAALKNLDKLKKYSMYGKYGFYESLDATPARVGKDPVAVKMYMSHHLSMSFLSAVNYLKDNIMVSRFFEGENSFYSELLEERVPDSAVVMQDVGFPHKKERLYNRTKDVSGISVDKQSWTAISDNSLSVILSDNGCGYTEYDNVRITKYRTDTGFSNSDCKGIFAAVKNDDCVLCTTYAPVFDQDASYKTSFGLSSVAYKAKKKNIETVYTATVIPNSDCELRRLSVKNNSAYNTDAEVVFYFEPVLTDKKTEETHPAFSGLFVSGRFDGATNILTLNRRNRVSGELRKSVSVTLFNENGDEQLFEYELTRFNILDNKRGMGSFVNAFNVSMTAVSSKTVIPVDPCVCIRTQLALRPFESSDISLVISVGHSSEDSLKKILRLKKQSIFGAIVNLNKITLSGLAAVSADKQSIKMADMLLGYIMNGERLNPKFSTGRPSDYSEIYKYGLSGDAPLIFIRTTSSSVEKCLSFIKAFAVLNYKGIKAELLIGYSSEDGYTRPIYNTVVEQSIKAGVRQLVDRPNGIFIKMINNDNDLSLLLGVSVFYADVERSWQSENRENSIKDIRLREGRPIRIRYSYKTGVGGYAFAGNQLGFGVDDGNKFPNMPPWCHILANPRFGTVVSNNNLGFTFGKSASSNRITPFTNDIIRDNDGEKLFFQIDGTVYDVIKGASAYYRKGFAAYETDIAGIRVKVAVFVCVNLPVKVVKAEFENTSDKEVSLSYKCNVTFGDKNRSYVNFTRERDMISFSSPYLQDRTDHSALLYSKGSRHEDNGLSVFSKSGERTTAIFYLGYAESSKRKTSLIKMLQQDNFYARELQAVERYWAKGRVNIKTLDAGLDLMFNGFLQYQIKASRLFGKTGFYQCSGAIGFRDQLQDTMALALTEPKLLKRQILLCCSKQFEEGDVLHWWFPASASGITKGARGKSADDLLWLPLAVCEFIERMDNNSILCKTVPYADGRELLDGENEAYIETTVSLKTDTVYQHCKKAIIKAIKTGKHGLLLFGSGDWNDGMSNVGVKGMGETVWGSFFAVYVLEKFSHVAKDFEDVKFAEYCKETATALRENIEEAAWDGQWYRRGYFDNGDPLGSYVSEDGKIDILPQSFAAICGGFDPARVRSGLDSADKLLVDRENKLIKLLAPPFVNSKNDPGYIMRYVPGVRENGGQYTHAAVWFAFALLKDGQYEKAYEILSLINPVNRTKTLDDVKKYRVEPYVLAGDIYSADGHKGMGGWTHYTGAAGWYYRIILQEVFGIKIRGQRLFITPALPKDWREFRIEMNVEKANLKILVRKARERKITVDKIETDKIILDGNDHEIVYQYLPV